MGVSKKRQVETMNQMKQTRYEDMVFLRELARQKMKWAQEEKKKGLEQIKKYEEAIKNTRDTVTRLDGYMVACKQLIEAKNEAPKETPKKETKDDSTKN